MPSGWTIFRRTARDLAIPHLGSKEADSFEDEALCGVLAKGSRIYRYGASESQASLPGGSTPAQWRTRPHREAAQWVFMTSERYDYSEDALHFLAILDATTTDLGERERDQSVTLAKIVKPDPEVQKGEGWTWSSAAVRAEFEAITEVPVWYGKARALAWDVQTGRIYKRPQHDKSSPTKLVIKPGGGAQILVPMVCFGLLRDVDMRRLQRVRTKH